MQPKILFTLCFKSKFLIAKDMIDLSEFKYQVSFVGMRKRVLVAMSGGVDSATTAALLKKQGYDVIGVTMQLWDYGQGESGCCSSDDIRDARRVAEQIGIPHYVLNYIDLFRRYVVSDFINKYLSGKTPSPCILCNQFMKFNFLLKKAFELGADYLATGHYARIGFDEAKGRFFLAKAFDVKKDQSYFLFTLTQNELKRLLFPLGSMTKEQVRELAKQMNLRVANKPDSQEVCFITGRDYREFLKRQSGRPDGERGEIVDTDGNVLGYHNGIFSFTIGQRRGIGIARGKPMYVVRIDPSTNRVIVGEEKDIFRTTLIADNVSWIEEPPSGEIEVKAKIRYRHMESDAAVRLLSDNEVYVEFRDPQRAMTPGQAIVFYKGERVLGGGWIKEVL